MAVNEQLEAWSESSLGKGALKKILSNTIETIEDNKTQIFGIYETAKDEVAQSRKVLEDLKFQTRQTIERVDALVVQEQQAKQEEQKPEEAKPEQPPEEKPEEPPPEETPPDEEPPEDDLFSLSVKRTGKGLEIKLLQGKKVVQESFVPAKANDFRKAMEALTDTLSEKVLNLR